MNDIPDATLVVRISERLRSISANNLQGLAEDMATVCAPHRFLGKDIQRRGRNEEAQTSKGWPDAFVVTGANTVDGIEATRENFSWKKHLRADLLKANDSHYPKLSGYFFVGGYPESAPSEKEIAELRNAFLKVGVPAPNLHLLIGRHLALELAQPKYAQVRRRWLGLQTIPTYFRQVVDGDLFPHDPQGIRPSSSDIRSGLVYSPSIVAEVVETLGTEKVALVRGHGACGKTTAAQLIAHHSRIRAFPVYYVDIATFTDGLTAGQLGKDLQDFAGDGALFIVDNIHLDEVNVASLLKSWNEYWKPINTHLLLLGRETRSKDGSPLLNIQPVLLRAGPDEMRGVIHRHLARRNLREPTIDTSVMAAWVRTFGGAKLDAPVDLLAFSSAVVRRAEQLARGDMRLSADDARQAVREGYLDRLNGTAELENLLALAALADYEIPVPLRALPNPTTQLRQSMELGICFEFGTSSNDENSYVLAHSALGPLLLAAASVTQIQARECRLSTAARLPYLGLRMARSPDSHDEKALILQQLKGALSSDAWLSSCLSLQQVLGTASNALKLGLTTKPELDALIVTPWFHRLVTESNNVANLCTIYGWFNKRGLKNAANAMQDMTDHTRRKRHAEALLNTDTEGVLAYSKVFPVAEILKNLTETEWNNSRFRVPPDNASRTSQLCRLFEREHLTSRTRPIAAAFVAARDSRLLFNSDLADISNIVRHVQVSESELVDFFKWLTSTSWFKKVALSMNVGLLSGALMSFANHLPTSVRPLLLTPEIEDRIEWFVSNTRENDISHTRRMTIRGACVALWGGDFRPWPQLEPQEFVEITESLARRKAAIGVGMYELQAWLGLMTLPNLEHIPTDLARDFLSRLVISPAPSAQAIAIQSQLASWLENKVNACV